MLHRRRYAWCLLVLPLSAACAVIVDPSSLEIRCELNSSQAEADPCREVEDGLRCIEGLCRPCDETAAERCDGEDDDCDGKIDEGHDLDNDGFTWCGGGIPEMADCVPNDMQLHPPASPADKGPEEVCDGKDNDCDSKVDEAKQCEEIPTCVDTGCKENERCDAESGVCIVQREVGSGCKNDSDCKGGFCLQPNTYNLGVSLMDARCASACCSDADCDKDSTCVLGGSGARVCLPRNIVGRGSIAAGNLCRRDSDCESLFCELSTCRKPCFNTRGCGEDACRFREGTVLLPGRWLCGDAPGTGREAGARCVTWDPGACKSGLCTSDDVCATPCGRDADCPATDRCEYVMLRPLFTMPSTIMTCVPKPAGTTNPEGLEALCCTTADCGADQLCYPTQNGDRIEMTCVKP